MGICVWRRKNKKNKIKKRNVRMQGKKGKIIKRIKNHN